MAKNTAPIQMAEFNDLRTNPPTFRRQKCQCHTPEEALASLGADYGGIDMVQLLKLGGKEVKVKVAKAKAQAAKPKAADVDIVLPTREQLNNATHQQLVETFMALRSHPNYTAACEGVSIKGPMSEIHAALLRIIFNEQPPAPPVQQPEQQPQETQPPAAGQEVQQQQSEPQA